MSEENETRWRSLGDRATVVACMLNSGMADASSMLALIDGVEPVLARRLVDKGITDLEDMAQADAADLGRLPDLSETRAHAWIDRAEVLIQDPGIESIREGLTCGFEASLPATPTSTDSPADWDPYRHQPALEPAVSRVGDGTWLVVTGGSDAHLVRLDRGKVICDCPDTATVFKHQIAVAIFLQADSSEAEKRAAY